MIRQQFTIWMVNADVNKNVRAFEDFALGMAEALDTLGHSVDVSTAAAAAPPSQPGRLILFGANMAADPDGQLPRDTIIYNAEQLCAPDTPWAHSAYLTMLRRHAVWDYAGVNVARMRELGCPRPIHCPVGYVRSMTRIEPLPEEDIDVLFYGTVNNRRRRILDAVRAQGLKVAHVVGAFGEARDALIARSKVVLNLHYYTQPVFEIFRCSHLFANRKCVVTEGGGIDSALEELARRAAVYANTPQDIADACRRLVDDTDARKAAALRGYVAFAQEVFTETVRRALAESDLS